MNGMKTVILLTLLTLLLVWGGAAIGGQSGMLMALMMAGVMNFVSYFFSDKIVLAMYRARQVDETEAPVLYRIVRMLSQKADIPMPKVYIIPDESPNAFATGRNPKHAAVAATEGIMRLLTEEELAGVMAHELAHVIHRDILIGTVAATIAGAISYLGHMALFMGGRHNDDEGGSPLAGIVMMI
ncbi:MAG: M48 family metalloprotease, partial [Thermodesulfovibrionales bacterium]